MELFLVLVLLGVAAAVPAEHQYANRERYYHEAIGIKEAARIKAAEETTDYTDTRIIGGLYSELGEFPYMGGLVISLQSGATSVCGSAMLTNTRAVTAAHCWWDGGNLATMFTVVYGSLTLFSGGVRVDTRDVILHGNWNPSVITNDVAVIAHSYVNYTDFITPIAMTASTSQFDGVSAQAVGFGRQSDNAGISMSQRLHHVTLQVISNTVCLNTFRGLPTTNICTSGAGGRSVCGGDSGGPLIHNDQLIGIVSFGHVFGCEHGHPQVFSRISSYRVWILDRI
ncbi:collagenase-like [Hyposmocoma kahamanoa]|uniref:collagenase-like n=1 Tax=Hyposmocoma kahamanoa TaxID=1477025 RepID=UPI000E6D6A90|nr:collagenase-like [Hyposmocoma kahamanoa]